MLNEKDSEITRSSISNATSYEEIGEFWDEHSLDDYWDQTYPVEFKINTQSVKMYYAIDETLSEQLRAVAESRGMSPQKLLNLWVQEKLQQSYSLRQDNQSK